MEAMFCLVELERNQPPFLCTETSQILAQELGLSDQSSSSDLSAVASSQG